MKLITVIILLTVSVSCSGGVPDSIDDVDVRNYDELFKRCNGNSCCEASARKLKSSGGFVLKSGVTCSDGYQRNLLRCKPGYAWCEPVKK